VTMEAPKTEVEVQDMSDATKEEIVGQVAISLSLTEDSPPPLEEIREIAQSLMQEGDAFKRWPLSNGRGGQTSYIENLHLAVMEAFRRPVTREKGVAEAYVDSRTKLPGDLPATGVRTPPPEQDED
jgi:hypothetical protein